ncbi:MAG TPA: hypothetical protein VM940_04450 [Chthoniobacterales bacterium]|nr:hypothetical protein [Chthoniobacterales bacterium]
MRSACVCVVLIVGGIAFGAGTDEKIVSKYTSTARKAAISFKVHKGEGGEADGFEGVFAGLGGYQLLHLSGDERSWINLRYGKATQDLYLETMKSAGGTFPNKDNDVVEWRGLERGGRFTPYAIIYRIRAGNDETRQTRTRLIVIKLDKQKSTVIGHAEGAGEDAKAKDIADRARPR